MSAVDYEIDAQILRFGGIKVNLLFDKVEVVYIVDLNQKDIFRRVMVVNPDLIEGMQVGEGKGEGEVRLFGATLLLGSHDMFSHLELRKFGMHVQKHRHADGLTPAEDIKRGAPKINR